MDMIQKMKCIDGKGTKPHSDAMPTDDTFLI